MKNDTFGFFLRDLREQNGLSQSQLGRLAGVSDKAVSKWENDTARPQSRLLYRLASVLGVTVDELLSCRRRPPENKGEGVCKMKDGLWKQAHHALRVRYGEALPVGVLNRYLSEFEALRMTDAILCFELLRRISVRAAETGEHVRAKGAIGSSFIAFVMGATEVNPLKAHTFCPNCRRFEWAGGVRCGWDIPEKRCACGTPLLRDGHDVPFAPLQETVHCLRLDLSVSYGGCKTVRETVRSFFADVPVVTLRRKAYPKLETLVAVTENIPGLTDGQTLPFEEYGILLRNCPAVTLMPDADLDALRRLEADTGISCRAAVFAVPEVLEAVRAGETQGVPELCSAKFRAILGTSPSPTFHDVIQALGLLHGGGDTHDGLPLADAVAYRDDIFTKIQSRMDGPSGFAYKVMHDVSRGVYARGGMSAELQKQLSALGFDERFTNSLAESRFMYPKAHGVLYARYALLFLYFRLHYPESFQKRM